MGVTKTHIMESQQTPRRINTKKQKPPRHVIFKPQNTKQNKEIVKEARDKQGMKVMVDFSVETMQEETWAKYLKS